MSDEIQHKPYLFLTPDSISWNPYYEHCANHEESMLYWEGNIQERKDRKKHIIDAPESRPISESYFEERSDMATSGASNICFLRSFLS